MKKHLKSWQNKSIEVTLSDGSKLSGLLRHVSRKTLDMYLDREHHLVAVRHVMYVSQVD